MTDAMSSLIIWSKQVKENKIKKEVIEMTKSEFLLRMAVSGDRFDNSRPCLRKGDGSWLGVVTVASLTYNEVASGDLLVGGEGHNYNSFMVMRKITAEELADIDTDFKRAE